MNADELLAHYENVADAPDAILRLRRFILDLAVRGKLVEQDPADEPASDLLERIAQEKARLVKRKGTKVIGRDPTVDGPFMLPSLWLWSEIESVVYVEMGQSPPSEHYNREGDGIAFFQGKADFGARHPTPRYWCTQSTKFAETGDVLLSVRAPVGPTNVADQRCCIGRGLAALRPYEGLIRDFLLLALKAFESDLEALGFGTTFVAINKKQLTTFPFPLPPLAEQHRIAAKVDELMVLLDRLGAARAAREATRDRLTAASLARLTAPEKDADMFPPHARFSLDALPALTARPDQIKQLRQTILNLAVRGKLVEQNTNDEPAAELLKRIATARAGLLDDDYPNPSEAKTQKKKQAQQRLPADLPKLPDGWSWATLQQCSLMVIDCKNKTAPYSQSGIKLVRTTNVRDGALNSNDQKFVSDATYEAWSLRAKPEPGDILITREAPMGEVCIIPEGERICLGQRMMLARLAPDTMDPRFMLYFLRDPDLMERVQDKPLGMTVQHLRVGGVETLLIPLPPLAEQRRIVAKVDELMALCDRLEATLTTTDTTRQRLLEALLHEALTPDEVREAAA